MSTPSQPETTDSPPDTGSANTNLPCEERRRFLADLSTIAMTGGLLTGYGTLAAMAGKFLFPAHGGQTTRVFLAEAAAIRVEAAIVFHSPAGEKIVAARRGQGHTAADFIALSSVCPHLGCQVFWESQNNRFFCPCHNGTFAADGQPTGGPPLAANQPLIQYPLHVEDGLLFIELPTGRLTRGNTAPSNAAPARANGNPEA